MKNTQTIFKDGRWGVVLRVVNALCTAGIQTSTDTRGTNGVYSVALSNGARLEAERVIASLDMATEYRRF